jgi:hypothetical protein
MKENMPQFNNSQSSDNIFDFVDMEDSTTSFPSFDTKNVFTIAGRKPTNGNLLMVTESAYT